MPREALVTSNTRCARAKRHPHGELTDLARRRLYSGLLGDKTGRGVSDVTALIQAAGNGDAVALQTLFGRVYAELKQMAHFQLAASSGHTLNTTGLVHEVYLKLAQPVGHDLQGRAHFFALAAKAMRQIVIDHARARMTDKRGAGQNVVTLDAAADVADSQLGPEELLRLDLALNKLATEEPRLAELVEHRFFAGLSVSDIAVMQSVSERTLNRDWRRAKAYLHATLYPQV